MERSKPFLIPEWLKGASGGAPPSPQSSYFQDGGSSQLSKPKSSRKVSRGQADHDSPCGAVFFERTSFTAGRRNCGRTLVKQTTVDRDTASQGRLHSNLTCSGSSKQVFAKEQERKRLEVTRERDWVQDDEGSVWSKAVEGLLGNNLDKRKKEQESLENGRVQLIIPDSEVKLPRPQPFSPGLSDSNSGKGNENVTASLSMPSVSGGLPTNIQRAAFERNFSSLGVDDKPVGVVGGSANSPVASPRPFLQSPVRSDLGRVPSPGLVGSMCGPSVTSLSNGGCGGSDTWSSVLAEVPASDDNVQNINAGMNAFSCSGYGFSYAATSCALVSGTTAAIMNMAEALSQPPHRVHIPPQSAAEAQRLEELALKQSRQLIPMTPPLPKAKSLSNKGKSKSRIAEASRSSSSSILDTVKHNQGKLLVLKSIKDNPVLATAGLKSEGSNTIQSQARGLRLVSSAQPRKPYDHRGLQSGCGGVNALAGVRSKDPMEDKRTSMQAQNRSDFFNTLRRKAASIAPTQSNPQGISSEAAVIAEADTTSHMSGIKLSGIATDCISHFHSNGGWDYAFRKESIPDDTLCIECGSSGAEKNVIVDSEEEEAAFMRSLGWEENAEDSELTEEEINAFYQMQASRKLLSDVRAEPSFNDMILTSSSDTDSEDEPPPKLYR